MLSFLQARLRVPLDDLKLAADSDVNLVITAPSPGDALRIATTVHRQSRRSHHPLVTLRFESTTQRAEWDHAWAAACTGTLLLLDTGRASLCAQEWLSARLRAECTPDARAVRVFAAAESTLHEHVQRGEFLESVYYQLNVIHLRATSPPAAWLPRHIAFERALPIFARTSRLALQAPTPSVDPEPLREPRLPRTPGGLEDSKPR